MAQRKYAAKVFRRMPKRNDKPAFTIMVEASDAGDAMDKIDKVATERGLDRPYIEMIGGQLS